MSMKNGVALKIVLVIFVLVVWSSYVSSYTEKDFNVPIYIETPAGIERANYDDFIDLLFNHNFEITQRQEFVPDERCSLRAEDGSSFVNQQPFARNKLSFNIPLKNDGFGGGSLTSQEDRDRFSASYFVTELIETSRDRLIFRAMGNGKLNQNDLVLSNIIVTYDKLNNKVSISGNGDAVFDFSNMEVTFIEGCLGKTMLFFIIKDNGALPEPRSISEVRSLLVNYPEFRDLYENLDTLNTENWARSLSVPNGGNIWTTREDCGTINHQVNQFGLGEKVYIHGTGFDEGEYPWYIKGQPGGASCDPNLNVVNGSYTVDSSGEFCLEAYTINLDDCGEYKTVFGGKMHNYHVDLEPPVVPEFGTIIGILTMLGAVSVFFMIRKK